MLPKGVNIKENTHHLLAGDALEFSELILVEDPGEESVICHSAGESDDRERSEATVCGASRTPVTGDSACTLCLAVASFDPPASWCTHKQAGSSHS